MTTVSKVPGRVRLKIPALRGEPMLCTRVETSVLGLSGVRGAEANHRTATLLVIHDESRANGSLVDDVGRALEECASLDVVRMIPRISRPAADNGGPFREAVVELAWHGLRGVLPPPFRVLLPLFRKLMAQERNSGGRVVN